MELTQEKMEEAMQKSCDEQVDTLKRAEEKQKARETVELIKNTYGDVLRRLANE